VCAGGSQEEESRKRVEDLLRKLEKEVKVWQHNHGELVDLQDHDEATPELSKKGALRECCLHLGPVEVWLL
jgi:hypothetical protein